MAPCCNNVVTPKMIKAGRVSVGDRIQLDEDYIKGGSETAPAAIPAAASPLPPPEQPGLRKIQKESIRLCLILR